MKQKVNLICALCYTLFFSEMKTHVNISDISQLVVPSISIVTTFLNHKYTFMRQNDIIQSDWT